jgi:HEPN domain-containing protein
MNRDALQRISSQRRKEAATLLKAGHFPGAYYLAGYAVECALKACIAKQTAKYAFPNKKLAQDCWTHDLERLIQLAGLSQVLTTDMKASPALAVNCAIAKDWDESSRYDLSVTKPQAFDLYYACTARRNGVLAWIRRRW